MLVSRVSAVAVGLPLLILGTALAAEPSWGQFKARFVYVGEHPKAKEVLILKDAEVCGKGKVFDESLLVNAKNGGLANVVVWMAVEKGTKLPPEHADHLAAAKKEVLLKISTCRFEPRVSLVRTNQPLRVSNLDPIGHNSSFGTIENKAFGAVIPAGPMHTEIFKVSEKLPVPIACNVHPWMTGRLLIQDHPYAAVSNSDGVVEIANVPSGKWSFILWHERIGWINKVQRNDREIELPRGRFDVEISSSADDFGTIGLLPKLFKN